MRSELLHRVEGKKWDVISAMKHASPEIVDGLVALSSSPDGEIRELVLWCLNEIGGSKARQVFLRALKDRREDVRDRALQFLQDHHAADTLPELQEQLRSNTDEFVREGVALTIGRIGDSSAIPALERTLHAEEPDPVRRAVRLALARLGQREARAQILSGLLDSTVSVRRQALEDFEYIADKQEGLVLLPLLDDTRDAMNVAPSGSTRFIRVCDLTVDVLDRVLEHPFSFPAGAMRRYSEEELNQAKQVLRQARNSRPRV
jgi:HEAT repeat protein